MISFFLYPALFPCKPFKNEFITFQRKKKFWMTKNFHCFSFLLMRNVHKFYSSKYIIKKNTLLFVFILYLELFTQLSVYCHFIFSFNKECFYYIKLVNLLCLYSRKIVRNKNAELCQKVILIHSFGKLFLSCSVLGQGYSDYDTILNCIK